MGRLSGYDGNMYVSAFGHYNTNRVKSGVEQGSKVKVAALSRPKGGDTGLKKNVQNAFIITPVSRAFSDRVPTGVAGQPPL